MEKWPKFHWKSASEDPWGADIQDSAKKSSFKLVEYRLIHLKQVTQFNIQYLSETISNNQKLFQKRSSAQKHVFFDPCVTWHVTFSYLATFVLTKIPQSWN